MLTPETPADLHVTDADGDQLKVMPRPDGAELYLGVQPHNDPHSHGVYLTRDLALQVLDHLAAWLYTTAPVDTTPCCEGEMLGHCGAAMTCADDDCTLTHCPTAPAPEVVADVPCDASADYALPRLEDDGYAWPDPTGDKPASVAIEAHAAVYGDRQDDYGHPREDFTRTAIIWTGLLQHKLAEGSYIEAEDIARCQIGVKLARDVHSPKRDNRVDMAGYAITLDRLETGK